MVDDDVVASTSHAAVASFVICAVVHTLANAIGIVANAVAAAVVHESLNLAISCYQASTNMLRTLLASKSSRKYEPVLLRKLQGGNNSRTQSKFINNNDDNNTGKSS